MRISFTPHNNLYFGKKIQQPQLEYKPRDFKVVEPEITIQDIIDEAADCLECKNPRCVVACPNNNPIPMFMHWVKKGDIDNAGLVLRAYQPLPACTAVCFHYCEDNCVKGIKGDSVPIHYIESTIGKYTEDIPVSAEPTGRKVAIIGGGPAGIACAKELMKKGHEVHIFDSHRELGGVLRYGIPSFRLHREAFQKEVKWLKQNGAVFHLNTQVGVDVKPDDFRKMGIDAIFIASGAGIPKHLNIPGEDLNGVVNSHSFLERVKLAELKSELYDVGQKVIVIGGGNVAMDCARTSLRLADDNCGDKDVTVVYRRSEKDMPARKNEIDDAKEEGVNFKYLLKPVKILSQYDMNNPEKGSAVDKVGGVKFEKMILSEPDENGKRKISPSGEFEIIEADTVVYALGSVPKRTIQNSFAESGINLVANEAGQADINPDTKMTSVYWIFAGGDVATAGKPADMTHAIRAGRDAAGAIDKYLSTLPAPEPENA